MEAKNINYHSIFILYLFKKMPPSEGHDATCARMVHHDADLVCNFELCSLSSLFQVLGMCIFLIYFRMSTTKLISTKGLQERVSLALMSPNL